MNAFYVGNMNDTFPELVSTILESTIENCTASSDGGGIFVQDRVVPIIHIGSQK